MEAIPVERVDVIAVGLDEVGLVDALLLVVGAGEVDAFLAAATVVRAGACARVFLAARGAVAPVAGLIDASSSLQFAYWTRCVVLASTRSLGPSGSEEHEVAASEPAIRASGTAAWESLMVTLLSKTSASANPAKLQVSCIR